MSGIFGKPSLECVKAWNNCNIIIIIICEKLKIPFSRFVPEIFSNKMTIK